MTEAATAGRYAIRPLRGIREKVMAADLLAAQIPHVSRVHVSPGEDFEVHEFMRWAIASLGEVLPRDIWLGAWAGRELVGAVHAGVMLDQASALAQSMLRGQVGAGSPGWLVQYVRRCLNVEELAVLPAHRGGGLGRRLIQAMHNAALADMDREVRHVTAHAGSAVALATFGACGYVLGEPRTPVPPQFAEGLVTTWDPTFNVFGGAYVYRHLSAPRPAAFFR